VLTKSAAIFENEAQARQRDKQDLAWLDAHWAPAGAAEDVPRDGG